MDAESEHMAERHKAGSGQVRMVPLASIRPSPVNDSVYRPPSPDDSDIQAMAQSMRFTPRNLATRVVKILTRPVA